jgi:hypothetical protein
MNLIQTIRQLFSKPQASRNFVYVRETADENRPVARTPLSDGGTELKAPKPEIRAEEIAFSPQGDLEAYVRGLALPKEAIERWISAGVLLPEETRVASQMIRIMCKNK